jgi:hypothetical protein
MAQQHCNYRDRESMLVAYLYDDVENVDCVAFEAHVAGCEQCRTELAAFRGVRSTLAQWSAPESGRRSSRPSPAVGHQSPWWQSVPVWAQAAAAMLVLGASLAIANLDVRYDRANGLVVRTGWSKPAVRTVAALPADSNAAPWRADLTALENQMRDEIRAQSVALEKTSRTSKASAVPADATITDAELRRRVDLLLGESQQQLKKDFALQLVQLQQDVYAQRQADLSRLYQQIGLVQNTTHNELASQRQVLNMAVSRRQ